jgi:histidinol dehydrogenase
MRIERLAELSDERRCQVLERSGTQIFALDLIGEIEALVEDVHRGGDGAVCRYTAKFDGVVLDPSRLRVTEAEFEAAAREVPVEVHAAIEAFWNHAYAHNAALARRAASWIEETSPGVHVGAKTSPVASAGLFVPSVKGTFPSTVITLGAGAAAAGVSERALFVPPLPGGDGHVDPAVLVAARRVGVDAVYRGNGPAGIAALAFGTETVPRMGVIAGPGGPAVSAAQAVVRRYGIVVPAVLGPTECMILADETADPDRLALDLLTEAEHGADSAALLVTWAKSVADAALARLEHHLVQLPEPRRSYAESSLTDYGGFFVAGDRGEALDFANAYAPEHLQIATRDPEAELAEIVHAGEILLGQTTPFAAANYWIGVPAGLPTTGFARWQSGITALSFLKYSSVARLAPEATRASAPHVRALGTHEGFPAHVRALTERKTWT